MMKPVGAFSVIDGKSTNSIIYYETELEDGDYKLYAAQQKPLSKEEILSIFQNIPFNTPLVDKVRAIEKAHGIQE